MTRPEKLFSTKGDHDPEDEYNSLDNPVLGRSKRREKYSKHLKDVTRSYQQSAILEEHFKDGKYKGQPSSRQELGYTSNKGLDDNGEEEEEQSFDYSDDDGKSVEDCSSSDIDSPELVDEDEQLKREMDELKRNEQVALKMIHNQQISDKQRGLHVRNQIAAWECLLDIEMRVHPLLDIVNNKNGQLVLSTKAIASIAELGRQLQLLASMEMNEQELNNEGRQQLVKWHQQAIASSGANINKTNLKTFNRDPWTLVDDAWKTDKERLLKRVRRSSNNTSSSMIFDDSEFHRFLMKEWTFFRSSSTHDPTVFRSINTGKRVIEGRVSKGRRLCFDPHPKLINYMMPRVNEAMEWADDKIDSLVSSLFK